MNITLLGGVNEIGGNKILVEHKGTRIMLDFGMSFHTAYQYFSEFLQPRKCASLRDFFEFGLLPDIRGIYREDYVKHMGRPAETRDVDAVFLSHSHADHAQYIHFLRKDIPIYCTEASKIILKVLEETGSGRFTDFITMCEAFTFKPAARGGGLVRVDRRADEYVSERQFHVMQPDKKVKIGSLEIEMIPVDHSLPGSCAYIIYSDEGNLVYTGDIRFHGYHEDWSEKFVDKAAESKPRWFLCEGTRIDQLEGSSEEDVKKELSKIISKAKELVFVEHPIRDIDRLKSIYLAAKLNDRHLVISTKQAYLIKELGDLSPVKLSEVKILIPPKDWGLICKQGIDCSLLEKDYASWEKEFIQADNAITCPELQKNPKDYVVSMSLWALTELVDIQPKNAVWIKSSCEPFSEEMELDEERKKHWLEHFKIKEYSAHASGHASGKEIRAMIKKINPKELIPIHTEHPEAFV